MIIGYIFPIEPAQSGVASSKYFRVLFGVIV